MLERGALRPSGIKKGPQTRAQDIGGASRRQGPGCLRREAARQQHGRRPTSAQRGKLVPHRTLLAGTSSRGPAEEQRGKTSERGGGVAVAAAARRANKGVDYDVRSSDDDNSSKRLCARATAGAAKPCMCRDEGLRTQVQVAPVRRSQQETTPTGKVRRA